MHCYIERKRLTSSVKIVVYDAELKSVIATSVVLALTVKSVSSDDTNLKSNIP